MSASACAQEPCLTPAAWYTFSGSKPQVTAEASVLENAAKAQVVLLGEQHDNAEHHVWQLQTAAALRMLRSRMVMGFEAFPRRVQPVLDQWIAGELTEQAFLERVEWNKVWSFPPELYLPLFRFARLNRIPMIALNVERKLTESVNAKGWDAVAAGDKEGLSRPAPATRAYEDELFEVFKQHAKPGEKREPTRSEPAFRRFVESQITWDRAMAEALAARAKTADAPLVVGIMGGGHVREGHGVPHQLRDLGVASMKTLLPVSAATPCSHMKAALADAIFAVPHSTQDKPPPPRLGIQLETRPDKSIAIAAVTVGSLAERSNIRAGDLVLSVAGVPVVDTGSIAATIRNQPAGTWLPMQLKRGDETLDVVVRFPPKT